MNDRLLFLISRASAALKGYLKSEFSRAGVRISPAQMGILFSLASQDGLSMNDLSGIVAVDNAAITRHIDALEKAQMVKREQGSADRRKYLIRITRRGLQEADKSRRVARMTNEKIKEGFTEEEIEVFKRVLSSFLDKFTV